MGDKSARFDAAYLERKRRQLTKLRDELRKSMHATEAEESDVKNESSLQAREYEDDAQKLDTLEKEGNLVDRGVERLARVERALSKIDEGTYGFSDVSGQRIPDHRLDVAPDAINTVPEQEASERVDQQNRAR
jgi:RNA polymerase-binding transcription factor